MEQKGREAWREGGEKREKGGRRERRKQKGKTGGRGGGLRLEGMSWKLKGHGRRDVIFSLPSH